MGSAGLQLGEVRFRLSLGWPAGLGFGVERPTDRAPCDHSKQRKAQRSDLSLATFGGYPRFMGLGAGGKGGEGEEAKQKLI